MRYRSKSHIKKNTYPMMNSWKTKNYIPNDEFLEDKELQDHCPCWPNHCSEPDHFEEFGYCWCSPVVTYYEHCTEIQHQKEN